MKKSWLITGVSLIGILAFIIYGFLTAFGPDYDKAEIKQKIGGTLICNSLYVADHHSWQFDVSYQYKLPNNKLINIGSGSYCGREWKKDEQLINYKNWTILKTGEGYRTDKIIIGNLKTNKWVEHEFTPESIESDSVWKTLNIISLKNSCCSESLVDQISDSKVIVRYRFRTSERQVDDYKEKKISYLIDSLSGQLKMVRVE